MIRKFIGAIFVLCAVLMLAGAAANGTLFSDKGTASETYGAFLGTVLPAAMYILSGFFFLTFDNAYKKDFASGFKTRATQCTLIVVFTLIYFVLFVGAGIGIVTSRPDSSIFDYITTLLPFALPLIVFISMLTIYATPFWACKKLNNASQAVQADEQYVSCVPDNSVLANNNNLYLPKLLCLIPLNQIASTQNYNQLFEKGIYLFLHNGKKIYIATKHYEAIESLINSK